MRQRTTWIGIVLLALTVWLALAVSISGHEPTRREAVNYANEVAQMGYQAAPGSTVGDLYDDPGHALGPEGPDKTDKSLVARFVSLGNASDGGNSDPRECEAHLILKFDRPITDGFEEDVQVFESGGNIGGGIEEPVDVFVSPDDENWYYVNRTIAAEDNKLDLSESVDTLPPGKGGDPAVFPYVGLCDYGGDGETSKENFPGPDIDAVKALNQYAPDPDTQVSSNNENTTVNDEPLDAGTPHNVHPGDVIKARSDGLTTFDAACKDLIESLLISAVSARADLDWKGADYFMKMLKAAYNYCEENPNLQGATSFRANLEFELLQGGVAMNAPSENLDLAVHTAQARGGTSWPSRFDVVVDEVNGETLFWARKAPLFISPVNIDLPVLAIEPGAKIIVTDDEIIGPFYESELFLPTVLGG